MVDDKIYDGINYGELRRSFSESSLTPSPLGENLGFEIPEGKNWVDGDGDLVTEHTNKIYITDEEAHSGYYSCEVLGNSVSDEMGGFITDANFLIYDITKPVFNNMPVRATLWKKWDNTTDAPDTLEIRMYWYDSEYTVMGSSSKDIITGTGSWESFSVTFNPLEGASYAKIVVYQEVSSGNESTVWIDDVSIIRSPISIAINGEDSAGDAHILSVDNQGRINLGSDIDVGSVNLLNTGDTEINPATEDSLTSEQPRESRDKVFTNINYGQDTVATSGTAEALNGGTSLSVSKGAVLTIRALNNNVGAVYIGDSSVTTSNGYQLNASESVSMNMDDVSTIYIDVDNNGDGASWIVESD